MIKYLPGATGIGQGTMIKLVRSFAGFSLGNTAKYLRRYKERRRVQRHGHNDQVPSMHNERHLKLRPGHRDQVPAT
jgi:hypothetical protein